MLITVEKYPCFICKKRPKVIDHKLSKSLGHLVLRDFCIECFLEKFDVIVNEKIREKL